MAEMDGRRVLTQPSLPCCVLPIMLLPAGHWKVCCVSWLLLERNTVGVPWAGEMGRVAQQLGGETCV